jgi:hypothetical protein
MRCANCGYISFDYLSECKKCRTSLLAARDGIGFRSSQPAVPFLLGSLLESTLQPVNTLPEAEAITSLNLTEETGASFSPGDEDPLVTTGEERGNELDRQSSATAGLDAPEEDFSLLDLSDEELEMLIDSEALENGNLEAIPKNNVSGGNSSQPPEQLSDPDFELPAAEFLSPEAGTESDLAMGDPDLSLEDCPPVPDIESELTFIIPALNDDPAGLEASDLHPPDDPLPPDPELSEKPPIDDSLREFEQSPENDVDLDLPELEDFTNDFVIDFSDQDFDALIEELSAIP